MKIGLIGAPGSGKSALAKGLRKALDGMDVVDDYVPELSADLDWKFGMWATYAGNVLIAGERLREEVYRGRVITCGTILDTIAYMSLEAARYDRMERRGVAALSLLGCLFYDTFSYDHVFYLPLTEPPKESDDYTPEFVTTLDEQLAAALQTFETKHTVLHGDADTKLANALLVVHGA